MIFGRVSGNLCNKTLREDTFPVVYKLGIVNFLYIKNGFTERRGTVYSLLDMKREVDNSQLKQVVVLLFHDISGAFQSAWWPEES